MPTVVAHGLDVHAAGTGELAKAKIKWKTTLSQWKAPSGQRRIALFSVSASSKLQRLMLLFGKSKSTCASVC